MNTAPNRRASDNASSSPGTSPTRRFSDMLKEGNGGGDSGSVLVIDITDLSRKSVELTIAYPETPDKPIDKLGIKVDTEIDVGTVIVGAQHKGNIASYVLCTEWSYSSMSGVDPSQVLKTHYTFTGSRIIWAIKDDVDDLVIIPPSLAKDLIPGHIEGGID